MDLKIVNTDFGKFWVNKDDYFYELLRENRSFVRSDIQLLASFIEENEVFIDVGAHIGLISLSLLFLKNIECICFEPNPENYKLLLKNIEANNKEIQITAVNGLIHNIHQNFQKKQQESNSGTVSYTLNIKGDFNIKPYQLDKFIEYKKNVRILKIDTEGAEYNVLLTAKKLIAEHKPIIFCELSMSHLRNHNHSYLEIENYLLNEGYLFFKNIGKRHSTISNIEVQKLNCLYDGGTFYDLLAIHKNDKDLHKYNCSIAPEINKQSIHYLKYLIHGKLVILKNKFGFFFKSKNAFK